MSCNHLFLVLVIVNLLGQTCNLCFQVLKLNTLFCHLLSQPLCFCLLRVTLGANHVRIHHVWRSYAVRKVDCPYGRHLQDVQVTLDSRSNEQLMEWARAWLKALCSAAVFLELHAHGVLDLNFQHTWSQCRTILVMWVGYSQWS